MNNVFESSGLTVMGHHYPALSLRTGQAAGWHCANHSHSIALLDMATGLKPAPSGGVVWFGYDLAGASAPEILRTMRRTTTLTWDGSLIQNLNIAENILLPHVHRHGGREAGGLRALAEAMEKSPPGRHLGPAALRKLPHELDAEDLPLVAVLRASLLQPEAIIACDIMRSLDHDAGERLHESIAWLRTVCPDAGWLVLQTGSILPRGLEGHIIGPET